jgi:Peptidase family M20/M25/M40
MRKLEPHRRTAHGSNVGKNVLILSNVALECQFVRGHEGPVIDIDEQQLWQRHMQLAQIGGLPNGGVDRQAFTAQEIEARRLIAQWAGELECQLFVDDIGNLFIRREGADPAAAPVVAGSHIDTQPTGGKFDGAYGVLAGLQVLQALNEAQISTHRSIEVAIWTNEEGCRFAPGMMGSEAFAGLRSLKDIIAAEDADGVTVADVLPEALAATPDAHRRTLAFPIAVYIEPHIEQGPILEAANCVIGVVTGIQGTRRFSLSRPTEIPSWPYFTPFRLENTVEGTAPNPRSVLKNLTRPLGIINPIQRNTRNACRHHQGEWQIVVGARHGMRHERTRRRPIGNTGRNRLYRFPFPP